MGERLPGATVTFVGAGPGAPDLLTLRGAAAIARADIIIWAASLVHPAMLGYARKEAARHDSSSMTLEEVCDLYVEAAADDQFVVRLQSGDPFIYGAINEQIDFLDAKGIGYEIVPGVTSVGAAAAAIGRELTVPDVTQSIVLTRIAGRTPMPEGESISEWAAHGSTLAIFLSAARPRQLMDELLEHYPGDTPAVAVYRASWEDERVLRCRLDRLADTLAASGLRTQVLVLVGPGLATAGTRSNLYDPAFATSFGSGATRRRAVTDAADRAPGDAGAVHEPDLPPSIARRTEGLRTGWTTGTCASAAAKAAVLASLSGVPVTEVDIALPGGQRVGFAVARCDIGEGWAEAAVVKDAGDDPDVTHGAELTVRVRASGDGDGAPLDLRAGEGVGTVTRPGLGLPVGAPAINPVPRRMIGEMVREAEQQSGADPRRWEVTVSVPGGEAMAKRTTNARLGIVGGISILGTTGIVRPFSTAAYRASIAQAIDVAAAQGVDELVLATGGRTEAAAMAALPALPAAAFVEVGDFTGFALKHGARVRMRHITFVGMMGKLAKLAAGVMMTHYTRSRVDAAFLAELAAGGGAEQSLVDAVAGANTARHAFELCVAAGDGRLFALVVERVRRNFVEFLGPEAVPQLDVVLVDFDGRFVVATEGAGWRA